MVQINCGGDFCGPFQNLLELLIELCVNFYTHKRNGLVERYHRRIVELV